MTREQFEAFCAEVRARRFDSVVSEGGRAVPLKRRRPFGAFGGCNPGIEEHMGDGFIWISAIEAYAIPVPPYGLADYVWTSLNSQSEGPRTNNAYPEFVLPRRR
jgi:hypothetical protein